MIIQNTRVGRNKNLVEGCNDSSWFGEAAVIICLIK